MVYICLYTLATSWNFLLYANGVLQLRDRQSSASLGLPSRIRDEDCDIEMLSASDLEETDGPVSEVFGTSEPAHVGYVLEMAKLAKLRTLSPGRAPGE